MKPRLDSAEFTEEDKAIWLRICEGEPFDHLACAALYATADRRDADLMLQLTDLRSIGAYANVRTMQTWWGQDGFGFGGRWIEWHGKPVNIRSAGGGYDITNFA